jgi:glycosyltransferase involved in cell wall biosynthesis
VTRRSVAILVDQFPELTETFVAAEARALVGLGWDVQVEAGRRAERPDPALAGGLAVRYATDDARHAALRALVSLAARHPLRCLADLVLRLGWRRGEHVPALRRLAPIAARVRGAGAVHLHAHFAAGAALSALRIGRLLAVPYSVTAHGYDIYLAPRNLGAKLDAAAFATSGSEYTVRHLRRLTATPVHKIVMAVDAECFRRTRPAPGAGRVVAVGRLVAKKGFGDLVEAMAAVPPPATLTIVGDGPLRDALAARAVAHGVADRVAFAGARPHAEVRDRLDDADLLVMPCVVASDGDRDSMPVVVKEALAMEVPVVATDEVGLPEVVRPEWGRLVPPSDPPALAGAIAELLALPAEERAAMGAAGRSFVQREADLATETARLAALIEAAAGRS